MISAKIIADSISEEEVRLTTMQVKFHRFILPEFNTHRMFSRNFSSSRAIPVSKMIEQVKSDPAMPVYWGENKSGMQADKEHKLKDRCIADWKSSAEGISKIAEYYLKKYNLHKQVINRLIEPFMWVNGVVTATEWDNFFVLRNHPAAQPEIQALARVMKQAMNKSKPRLLKAGEWHLPYINDNEITMAQIGDETPYCINLDELIKASAARCARVSYNKHDGTMPSVEEDLELFNQLATRPHTDKRGFVYGEDDPVHLSPLEHQATPMSTTMGTIGWDNGTTHMDREGELWSGNFKGWNQYRQLVEGKK